MPKKKEIAAPECSAHHGDVVKEVEAGLTSSELLAEMAQMRHIAVQGLMTIPPVCDDPAATRSFFSQMHQLFVDIGDKKRDNIKMSILSMGMSGDYEDAIACGSNLVRVGSAIFGARIYP